jgi:DNA-binding CsgD family transcriptional regulator
MTPRELQVAELVCRGYNNDEIAKNLNIKHGTVKTHLRNVYRRVRVKNKIAMLLKFVDQASKFFDTSGITPPIPIVDMKEQPKKTEIQTHIRKEEN